MTDSVVVAGAGGFIGGHLVNRLVAEGYLVKALDIKPLEDWHQQNSEARNLGGLDLSEGESCRSAIAGADIVYDLAADMGGMGFIANNHSLCMLSVRISSNILDAARHAGVSRTFFSSSACVYNTLLQQSTDEVQPLREEDAYPAYPEDGYGWEKLFSERLFQAFDEDFGITTRIARYHNSYGPFGTFDGGREKAPAAICRKVAEAALSGSHKISVWGDGNQVRSYMYVDDCVEGTRRLMESGIAEPLNVGSSEAVSVNQLVSLVEDIAGVQLDRSYDMSAPRGVAGRNSDNSKILSELGWEPSTSLREGLEATYSWIYDQVASRRA